MNNHAIRFLAAAAIAVAPLASHALGTNEKGCLVGGAAGGVAGHTLGSGNHTLLGAAIGCGAGVLVNKERVKKIDAKKEEEKKVAARKQRHEEKHALAQQGYVEPRKY